MSALVVFIGAPGAGKTRTGKRVARLMGAPFIDTDKRIAAEHGPIPDLFATHGEPHFRRIERDVVAEALREDAVVSLGGGAVLDVQTQADLESLGAPVVQLTTTPEAVAERITDGRRPLLADGVDAWVALVEARKPLYDRLATLTIDTSFRPMDDVAKEVHEWLRRR